MQYYSLMQCFLWLDELLLQKLDKIISEQLFNYPIHSNASVTHGHKHPPWSTRCAHLRGNVHQKISFYLLSRSQWANLQILLMRCQVTAWQVDKLPAHTYKWKEKQHNVFYQSVGPTCREFHTGLFLSLSI